MSKNELISAAFWRIKIPPTLVLHHVTEIFPSNSSPCCMTVTYTLLNTSNLLVLPRLSACSYHPAPGTGNPHLASEQAACCRSSRHPVCAAGTEWGWLRCRTLTTVLEGEQGVVSGQRLRRCDVQACCCDLPMGQGVIQVLLVHHSAPGKQRERPRRCSGAPWPPRDARPGHGPHGTGRAVAPGSPGLPEQRSDPVRVPLLAQNAAPALGHPPASSRDGCPSTGSHRGNCSSPWHARQMPCVGCPRFCPTPQEGDRNGGLLPDSAKEPCHRRLHPKNKAYGGHSPLLGNPSASPARHPTLTRLSTPRGRTQVPREEQRLSPPSTPYSAFGLMPRSWAGGHRPHTGQTVPAAAAVMAVHSLPDPPAATAVQETVLQLPARVDEHGGLLHSGEEVLVAHSLGGRSQSTGHHNKVRFLGQPRERD